MRYSSGAKGSILASQVLPGNGNNVSFRIYGDKAGLEWWQEKPEELWFTRLGERRQMIRRNGAGATSAAIAGSRVPAAHPEGYLEAFANLYRDAADLLAGKTIATRVPSAHDGVSGSKFVEACLKSNAAGNAWTEIG